MAHAGRAGARSRDEPPANEEVSECPSRVLIDDAADGGHAADHAAIERLASELLPALIAKLGATGLGELEVRRRDGWRVRLPPRRRCRAGIAGRQAVPRRNRATPATATVPFPQRDTAARERRPAPTAAGPGFPWGPRGPGMPAAVPTDGPAVAVSPAVGVFRPNADTTAGRRVRR